ncbi:MAG: hypothetical protein AAB372_02725 [Patescibacteria group bacterium]
MLPTALFEVYRLRHDVKISALRLLGYVGFGLVIGRVTQGILWSIDLVIVFFGILSASFFNDYYDARLRGEENVVMRAGMPSLLYGFVPLGIAILAIGALWYVGASTFSLMGLGGACVLSILYSIPPVRLKDRGALGAFFVPIGIYLLFWQALFLERAPDMFALVLAWNVFIFAWYLELLHWYEDAFEVVEPHRLSPENILWILYGIVFIQSGLLLGAGIVSPIFLISGFAWALRFWALRFLGPHTIHAARRSIMHPIWRLEEFALYGLIGIIHIFV